MLQKIKRWFKYTWTNMFWSRICPCNKSKLSQKRDMSPLRMVLLSLMLRSVTFPLQPVFALAVEQQLVVDIRQQELDTPALNTQLILHQQNGTAVVACLWTRDHANLITEGANTDSEGWGSLKLVVYEHERIFLTTQCVASLVAHSKEYPERWHCKNLVLNVTSV